LQQGRSRGAEVGWANHFRQQAMVELLTPLTTVMEAMADRPLDECLCGSH
jgi:hypothetical protein